MNETQEGQEAWRQCVFVALAGTVCVVLGLLLAQAPVPPHTVTCATTQQVEMKPIYLNGQYTLFPQSEEVTATPAEYQACMHEK